MATIKQWLDDAGFDWENGTVVVHEIEQDEDDWPHPGSGLAYEFSETIVTRRARENDFLLNRKFDCGLGSANCPRFFARDENNVYFPAKYDGSTWLEVVNINPEAYLGNGYDETPYPGGGG